MSYGVSEVGYALMGKKSGENCHRTVSSALEEKGSSRGSGRSCVRSAPSAFSRRGFRLFFGGWAPDCCAPGIIRSPFLGDSAAGRCRSLMDAIRFRPLPVRPRDSSGRPRDSFTAPLVLLARRGKSGNALSCPVRTFQEGRSCNSGVPVRKSVYTPGDAYMSSLPSNSTSVRLCVVCGECCPSPGRRCRATCGRLRQGVMRCKGRREGERTDV